jgi:hypothetical protein
MQVWKFTSAALSGFSIKKLPPILPPQTRLLSAVACTNQTPGADHGLSCEAHLLEAVNHTKGFLKKTKEA